MVEAYFMYHVGEATYSVWEFGKSSQIFSYFTAWKFSKLVPPQKLHGQRSDPKSFLQLALPRTLASLWSLLKDTFKFQDTSEVCPSETYFITCFFCWPLEPNITASLPAVHLGATPIFLPILGSWWAIRPCRLTQGNCLLAGCTAPRLF